MGCAIFRFGGEDKTFVNPCTINPHAIPTNAVETKTRSRGENPLNAFAVATTANGAATVTAEAAANAAIAAYVRETARVVANTAAWVAALPDISDVPENPPVDVTLSRGGPEVGDVIFQDDIVVRCMIG